MDIPNIIYRPLHNAGDKREGTDVAESVVEVSLEKRKRKSVAFADDLRGEKKLGNGIRYHPRPNGSAACGVSPKIKAKIVKETKRPTLSIRAQKRVSTLRILCMRVLRLL